MFIEERLLCFSFFLSRYLQNADLRMRGSKVWWIWI